MLRPRDQQWLHARTLSETLNNDLTNKRYLDWLSAQLRQFMYDRRANFTRSAKELDAFWVSFGNGVATCEPRRERDGITFRTWHLRDTAWAEDSYCEINQIHRNWNPQGFELQDLAARPPDADGYSGRSGFELAPDVANLKDEDKLKPIKCRHIMIPAKDYDLAAKKTRNLPWVSIYIDIDNETILEEIAVKRRRYIIPRWEFASHSLIGSPYAYSPPAVYALPDARMFQDMTRTLLEAGQKSVDPPMIGVGEAIQGGTNLFAGGMTWTDADYDERMGEVLRPLNLEFRGLQFGAAREERLEKILQEAFFNSALQFPTITKEMTAEESRRLYEQFIRKATPLIEPICEEYNGQVCEMAFDTVLDMGGYGSPYDMPQALRGQQVRFQFDTPLQAAAERAKASAFGDAVQLTVAGAQVDPTVVDNVDWNAAYRDAVYGAGSPADWILPIAQVQKIQAQKAQAAQAQQQANAVAQGTDIAERMATAAASGGKAAQALQQAGVAQ